MKLLLVEDLPADIRLIEEAIVELNYPCEVSIMKSGRELFRHLKSISNQELPDLILLDYSLPMMSGDDILYHLKESLLWQGIPVVVFSSSVTMQDQARFQALGAEGFLIKPYAYDDLLKVLQGVLSFWDRRGLSA